MKTHEKTHEKKTNHIPPVKTGGDTHESLAMPHLDIEGDLADVLDQPGVETETPKVKAKEIAVVAMEKGVYDNQRKNEGDKFTVKPRLIIVDGKKVNYSAEEQVGKWMKKI